MTACAMTRWHPFRTASAPSKPCVLDSGHDGMCHDGWGGVFEGTRPRPRSLSPEEVDAYNRANDAQDDDAGTEEDLRTLADDVKACPVTNCALLKDHQGKHMDLQGREWAGTLPTEAMAAQVSHLLTTPGLPARSVGTLRRADNAFGLLDALMRSGAPLPSYWHVDEHADDSDAEHVTHTYDALSEALRETGEVAACFTALRAACAKWKALDAFLRVGAPLPEPWRR